MKNKGKMNDVEWYIDKTSKRPFAYSTIATSNLIAILSKRYITINEVYNNIHYDNEAKEILRVYIGKGLGNEIASNWFGY